MLYENLSHSPEGRLVFSGYDTAVLAQQYGTPLMVMDEMRIRNRCRTYKEAMAEFLPWLFFFLRFRKGRGFE